jgi:hypothetical protein
MPVTPWYTAGTVTGTDWTATSGTLQTAVASDDNVWAQAGSSNVNYLICSNFAVSLPAGAIIEGHEVQIYASATDPTIFGQTVTIGCRLSKDAANAEGNERTGEVLTYPPDSEVTLGGPTDLWAGGWTDTEVEDGGFALLIRKGSDSTDSAGRQVDLVRVRIYYSEPETGAAVIGGSGQMVYIPGYGVKNTGGDSPRKSE